MPAALAVGQTGLLGQAWAQSRVRLPAEKVPRYSQLFYRKVGTSAERSAREIVPLAVRLLEPRTVVDVGCGLGDWLAVFKEFGVHEVLGIDGDWVPRDSLRIDSACFLAHSLAEPLSIPQQFDLVVCLEVAEHLPAKAAAGFIQTLTRLGPAVMFSAAVPYQSGTGHVNEQWPEYWADLFAECRYLPLDYFRPLIWRNSKVSSWYCQNLLLFVQDTLIETNPRLKAAHLNTRVSMLSVVHPRLFVYSATSARRLLKMLAKAMQRRLLR